MNALSLAYSNAKKQPSWIDDPFDLKGFVTGVTPLQKPHSLDEYALELVSSYGEFIGNQYELNLEKVSSACQLELVRLYIESIDREIEWACYGDDQSINSDFLCAILAMLQDSNPKTRANFAQVTTRNLLVYYKDTLQELLNTACYEFYCNEMHEAGYRAKQDMEHGDVVWSKF